MSERDGEPHACGRCGRRFARAEHLALHGGRAHAAALEPGERAAFEAARAEEDAWLAVLRRRVRGALAVLPIVVTWLLVVLLAWLGGVPVLLGLLLLPGVIAMGAVVYHLASTHEAR